MPTVVSVRLRHPGQFYDFATGDLHLSLGDWVIVETARGQDAGVVVLAPREIPPEEVREDMKPVVRLATPADLRRMERSREREPEVLERTRTKVAGRNLPMRLVAAEYTYNGRSLTIYFTSEQRVDFRELVKELAREFHARIELRQIGARDEARLLGGIGSCGRTLCCASWLHDFLRISVRMAKEQDLPLSPTKISGVCGRLLCCLSYECDQYREIKAQLPTVGEEVVTLRGRGKVVAISVPRETATVEIRQGLTVEATAEEVAHAAGLEAEGKLAVQQPAYGTEPEEVEEPSELHPAPAVEGERPRRRRRRRRKKEAVESAVTAEKAPAAASAERRRTPHRPRPPQGTRPEAPPRSTPPEKATPAARSRRRPRRRPPKDAARRQGRPES